jgi:hypothetical protein
LKIFFNYDYTKIPHSVKCKNGLTVLKVQLRQISV